ncbi:gamma-glutamyltranspeptidase [Xenococcus sp. PCC 7305]|uniref:gamma-glutamyltransferase n=1 Tax=Xenococcus sp. PCC 7305 TaxID=102125 RepID=UPI0002ABA03E|nr:gamma-glutamyltransferase [Xenococcus sp. PCC 7305]ELS05277.1 gamma-glutamyltranspeptidase [Xenococcus sp. PCC 7305]
MARKKPRYKLFLLSIGVILGIGVFSSFNLFPSQITNWWECLSSPLRVCQVANAESTEIKASGYNGAVVSTQKEASQIGLEVLTTGGNAIDAAVAIGYALAVSDPCCGNIGGGGFMLIHLADGTETFINFRETAPLAATADMYLDPKGEIVKGLSTKGYLAVGVPGTVKGLNYALAKYGTWDLEKIITPAIALAEKGFVLQQGDIDIFQAGKRRLLEPNVAEIFLKGNDQVYQAGDILVQSDLAESLKLIAQEGNDAFYQGSIAQKIVTASNKNQGILSLEDFANYQVSEYAPVSCNYRGYQVTSSPPPGGGTTLCQMLNILSGYDLQNLGWKTPQSLHPILSSMLLAFSDRNQFLGDPDFVDNPLEKLLSSAHANFLRAKIPEDKAIAPESVYPALEPEGTNTTHYSVIDKQGNAVAVTYTINSYFGAGVIAPGTGFLLNNEMDDFTSKPGKPNQFGLRQGATNKIEPGKRPLSSMSPTIVTKDNRVVLVTGSPGGSTIPTTVLQVITNAIDYEKDISTAVNSPRFHYQGLPDRIIAEPEAISAEVIQDLELRGYTVKSFIRYGAAESIAIDLDTGLIEAVNDSRKSAGQALAY